MSKTPKRISQILSEEDFNKVLNIILYEKQEKRKNISEYSKFLRLRNVVILSFMYYCGLRPKEAYDSKLSYVDINKNTFYIPAMNNKQRQEDTLDIPNFVMNFIYSYLVIRKKFYPESEWLFPNSQEKGRLNRSSLAKIFKKAVKEAGFYQVCYVDKKGLQRGNLSLYSLRVSYGTFVYSKTKDIRRTALMLRHRDYFCRTTLCYVRVAEASERKAILNDIYPQERILSI